MKDTYRAPPRRLGIQFKIASIIVICLMITLAASSITNYLLAQNHHRSMVDASMQQLQSTLKSILARSSSYLVRITNQLDIPEDPDSSLDFEPRMFSGIESINILEPDGGYLFRWSLPVATQVLPDSIIRDTAANILLSGRPTTRLYCEQHCLHSIFIPQIDRNGNEVIVNANLSLVDLVRDFQSITGADIAFFTNLETQLQSGSAPRPIISSAPEQVSNVLLEVQELRGRRRQNNAFQGNLSAGYFASMSVNLDGDWSFGHIDAVIVANQNQTYSNIQRQLRNELIGVAISLTVAAIVLVGMLRAPLKRVQILSQSLPLLAELQFHRMREGVEKAHTGGRFVDEIDTLAGAMLDTSDSLAKLTRDLNDHRQQLEEKIHQLQEAQQLNQALVDGSPLAIITYTEQGRVLSMNLLARQISGRSDDSLDSLAIDELILPDESGRSINQILASLLQQSVRVQSEQPMARNGDRQHVFNWIHTRLDIEKQHCYLSVGLDITENRESEARMRWLSKHDHITGLPNLSTFTEEAQQQLEQNGGNTSVTLLMFDIDDFSMLNDQYGLQIGDMVLAQTAHHLRDRLPEALLARTGSNEFVALLNHFDNGDIQPESLCQVQLQLQDLSLQISLTGVFVRYPEHGSNIEELLSNASNGIQHGKDKHRGSLFDFDDAGESRDLRQEKLAMRDQLLAAFEQNRFVLFYQPIYNLASRKVSHCECLIRLLGSDGHFIPPGQFLNIASEFNLMPQLDRLVLQMAMQQQSKWSQQGLDIKLSINVTPSTFQSDGFQDELRRMIRDTGAQGNQLIFEIVETEALDNIHFAQAIAGELTAIGAELAFDDFGIGFTSFEYLRELPVNYVKIDKSFIRYLDQRDNDQLLVKSMVDMSLALGKKVIAEGVENRAAFDLLASMGVHYLQGYYIARPAPVSDLDFRLTVD